jgi:hypothetical protein
MAVSAASSAAMVSFNYTGVSLDGNASVSGTFGYDDETIDSYPEDSYFGEYTNSGFWSGAVTGGSQDGATFNFSNMTYAVYSDDPDFGDALNATIPDSSNSSSFFDLDDYEATVFEDDSLPAALPFDAFDFFEFQLGTDVAGDSPVTYEFSSITASTITPVPLPAAAWLFGSVLIGFISWSSKKQVN